MPKYIKKATNFEFGTTINSIDRIPFIAYNKDATNGIEKISKIK